MGRDGGGHEGKDGTGLKGQECGAGLRGRGARTGQGP